MKEKKRYLFVNRIKAALLIIAIVITNLLPVKVQAATTISVETVDFSDFSNWRSGGYYYSNGKYVSNSNRLCLIDYVTFSNSKYKAHISSSEYKMLIRELDINKNLVTSVELTNGQEYEPKAKTVYLAIGIYRYVGEHNANYKNYTNLFNNGFIAELKPVKTENTSSGNNEASVDESEDIVNGSDVAEEDNKITEKKLENIDLTDFSNWRSGVYHYSSGKYTSNNQRLCLNDYVTFENSKYTVKISDTAFQLLIRELNSKKEFIKSYNLKNGETYTPSANAEYLAIGIYKVSGEYAMNYSKYKEMFANGFCVDLKAVKEVETEDEIVVIPPIENSIISSDNTTASDNTSVSTGVQSVYDVLKQALLTNDSNVKDISKYNISTNDFYVQWNKIKEDCYLEYHTYGYVYPLPTVKNGVVTKFNYENMDSGYAQRLEKVKKVVSDVCASVDGRMSDMEKVLFVHEYVVDHTSYLRYDQSATMAGGPLANGYGICGGYADAMMVLLHYLGIETVEVTSGSMGHGWLMVKVDGEWYHVDPTWDDTAKGTNGIYEHRFFIRNDEEFLDIGGKKHYNWSCTGGDKKSASTKYEDWFVHNVSGSMYYYNGLWYYRDNSTNSIVCSDINNNSRKVVVDGTQKNTTKVCGISGNVMTYMVGTQEYTMNL